MNEASFASLNSGLLARKGGAKPAMRPQMTPINPLASNLEDLGWNDMGDEDEPRKQDILQLTPEPANPETENEARRQDAEAEAQLHDRTAEVPMVRKQQEAIVQRIIQPKPFAANAADDAVEGEEKVAAATVVATKRPARARRSALAQGKRAAFTLRLDEERHLKLRLACTIRGRSAQQIVTEALDAILGELPELDSLAAQVKRR